MIFETTPNPFHIQVGKERNQDHYDFLLNAALKNSIQDTREEARKSVKKTNKKLIQETGWGFNMTDLDFSNLDLSEFQLSRSILDGTNINSTNFSKSSFIESLFRPCSVHRGKFDEVNFKGSFIHSIAWQNCSFINANMQNLKDATGGLFHGCDMQGVKLNCSKLDGTSFYQCKMELVDMDGCSLNGSIFNETILANSILTNLSAKNLTLLNCVARGSNFANSRLYESFIVGGHNADFTNSNFSGLILTRSFVHANLEGSDFSNSILEHATFDLSAMRRIITKGAITNSGTRFRGVKF